MATIDKVHGFADTLNQQIMSSHNPEAHHMGGMPRLYPIHRHIHIFSVAKRAFRVQHPYCKQELRGCKDGERYVLCASIPDPPQQIAPDVERGGRRVEVEPGDNAGWRTAIDVLNPNNPTMDPYFESNGAFGAYFGVSQNCNLVKRGLFPSLNQVPTEHELLKAEQVRDDGYRELVDQAIELEATNPAELKLFLKANPDVHQAMDVLGLEANFHKKHEVKIACPNCGGSIKQGLAFHVVDGRDCILDWKRALEAGRIKKSDVPDSKRWWKESA